MMILLIIDIDWIDRISVVDRIDFGDDDVILLLLLSRQSVLRMLKINLRLYSHSLSVFIVIALQIVIDNNIVIVKIRIKK